LGPLAGKLRQLIAVLELVQVEAMVGPWHGGVGRPALHGRAIARAFVAKAIYNLSDTWQLLDRLQNDVSLQCICGWSRQSDILHESRFSRAFASFAASQSAPAGLRENSPGWSVAKPWECQPTKGLRPGGANRKFALLSRNLAIQCTHHTAPPGRESLGRTLTQDFILGYSLLLPPGGTASTSH